MSFKITTQWTNNTEAIGKDLNLVEKANPSISNDLDMNSKKIINLSNPSSDADAVPKKYLHDNFLSSISNASMHGSLNMRLNSITNVKALTFDNDAVNKTYVNDNFLKTSGGAITGSLDI